MKKVAVVIVFGLMIYVFTTFVFKYEQPKIDAEITSLKLKNVTISAEIADTPQKRQQGLMNRTKLNKNTGMLFVFEDQETHPFWMKNTLLPLDIIWIDDNYKVVHVEQNVPPCPTQESCPVYRPQQKAKYVLELNAGFAKEFGVRINDTVTVEF